MAQIDVFENPNKAGRKHYPYILDIQSPIIDQLSTRLVIPLGKLQDFGGQHMKRLSPVVEFDGEDLVLLTPLMASIPTNSLKTPVGTMAHSRDMIISAIDFAVTGN